MSSKIRDIKTRPTNAIFMEIESIRNNNQKAKTIRSWEKAARVIENDNNASPPAKHKAGELRDALSMMGGRKTRRKSHKRSKSRKSKHRKSKHRKSRKY